MRPILIFRNDKLIAVSSSLRETAQLLNVHHQNIFKVLRGERKTVGGFTFRDKSIDLFTFKDLGMKLSEYDKLTN